MTIITIYKEKTGMYHGFSCSGHAGFARAGEDVVCAGISALVLTTVNALEQVAGADIAVNTDEETGYIRCLFRENVNEASRVLMDALVLGVTQISEQYGKRYCKIVNKEV